LHAVGQEELDSVAEVLSGPILTTGENASRFEGMFAERLGLKNSLAVTSCTGALNLSLLSLGIGAGDEVITTPLRLMPWRRQ